MKNFLRALFPIAEKETNAIELEEKEMLIENKDVTKEEIENYDVENVNAEYVNTEYENAEYEEELFPQVTTFKWLIVLLVSFIPIIGQLMLVVWAFGSRTNPSLSNYAKAALIYTGVLVGLVYLYSTIILGVFTKVMNLD